VLNEQGAIGPTLARLPRDSVSDIFVVDGGSTDGTCAEAAAHGATVIAEQRRGYGRACLPGVEHAAAAGANIVLFMDGSMGLHQVLAGEMIGLAVGMLAGVRYSDMCAFRAISVADLLRLDMREMTYGWNLEMQIKAPRAGLRVREVALPYYRRVAGVSKVAGNLSGSIKAAGRIIATFIRVGTAGRM
jgi:glycosyltransferase involved in cell wall biosynthesis